MAENFDDTGEYEYDPYADYDEGNDGEDDLLNDDAKSDGWNEEDGLEHAPPPERWSQLRIGDGVVDVSTEGRVKLRDDGLFSESTYGVSAGGTPYRFVTVDGSNYYVHHLVWHAFCGAIPNGYEIRHHPLYVSKRARVTYANKLSCITMLPITVSPYVPLYL